MWLSWRQRHRLPSVTLRRSDGFWGGVGQGMQLGIRAIVAAGATAVTTLTPAGRFEVERHLTGELANPKAFEKYLDHVKTEGVATSLSGRMKLFTATMACGRDGCAWSGEASIVHGQEL